jgi:DNA-directed RNA polymerase II subunit RPB2
MPWIVFNIILKSYTENNTGRNQMERDCMIAQSASKFLKERLFEVSDPFQVSVCDKCGVVVSNNKECQACKADQISSVNLPYAGKLCFQELSAMCIKSTIIPCKK